MFSLRDSSCACSSGTDEDPFGWWIGAKFQLQDSGYVKADEPVSLQQPQSVSSSDSTSCAEASSEDSGTSSGNYVSSNSNNGLTPTLGDVDDVDDDNDDATEDIELKSLGGNEVEAEEDEGYVLRDGCYTPERLVEREEFRILTPEPRFYPSIAELETAKARLDNGANGRGDNGAERLARLLRSHPQDSVGSSKPACKRCCPVRYGNGEVILHTEHCPRDWKNRATTGELFKSYSEYDTRYSSEHRSRTETTVTTEDEDEEEEEEDESRKAREAHNKIADDSSGIFSVDGLCAGTREDEDEENWGYESECEGPQGRLTSRRVSSELAYVSLEYGPGALEEQNNQRSDAADVENTCIDRSSRLSRSSSLNTDLARLALVVEPDVRLPSIRIIPADTEAEIERLRDRIDRLQGNNKEMYEEISSLKRDFAIDECKVNHLSEDVSKLQTEVNELRYLDDLLKLLKGELERISKRNWPFAIGNTKGRLEDINLVV